MFRQITLLRQESNRSGMSVRSRKNFASIQADKLPVGFHCTEYNLHKYGFPRAISAEQSDDVSRIDSQVDIRQ